MNCDKLVERDVVVSPLSAIATNIPSESECLIVTRRRNEPKGYERTSYSERAIVVDSDIY